VAQSYRQSEDRLGILANQQVQSKKGVSNAPTVRAFLEYVLGQVGVFGLIRRGVTVQQDVVGVHVRDTCQKVSK
jgi:hypothetical protein